MPQKPCGIYRMFAEYDQVLTKKAGFKARSQYRYSTALPGHGYLTGKRKSAASLYIDDTQGVLG